MVRGTIMLDNGLKAYFSLVDEEIAALKREATELEKTMDAVEEYNFLHVLTCFVIHKGIALLIEQQRGNQETPGAATPRESK